MNCGRQKVVIVTGASRGIGRAIAKAFGSGGNNVVVNYLNHQEEARSVAEEIAALGGMAFPFRADVRIRQEINAMVDETISRWKTVDVLVNNAGLARDGLLLRMNEKDWDDVISVNLTGSFNCISAVAEVMKGQQKGHIVSLSSISGVQGREGQANYAAAKAGLIGLTRAAAQELGRFNINVNVVLPGYIPTDLGGTVSGPMRARILSENVLGRPNDADEVAEFIVHLSSMRNASGQVFNLDSRVI